MGKKVKKTKTEEEKIIEFIIKNGGRELTKEEMESDLYRDSIASMKIEPPDDENIEII